MMQQATGPPQMAPPQPSMDNQPVQQPYYQQPWMMMTRQPPQAPLTPPMWNPQHQQPQMQQQPLPQPLPQQQMFPPHTPALMPHQSQPPPQQQQYQQQPQYPLPPPASADEVRTLWIGDLQYWMDENYILSCFAHTGEVVSVKLIRNKQSSQLEGYGFIEFVSRAAAERILQAYNGTLMPNVEQNFRLNWASFGVGEKRLDGSSEFTIFVGDLTTDVTDYTLQEAFRVHYPSVRGAKVVSDKLTGRSKGYGFVKFGDESEQLRAMTEMNGMVCSTRPMRIGPATNKNGQQYQKASYQQNTTQEIQSEGDLGNTTIFIGGLDPTVTEDLLRQVFSKYGELVHVKIPVGKRCGFVQYAIRSSAEEALRALNGIQLGGQTVRLSWGHSPSNKQQQQQQPQQDSNTMNGGYYQYGQGYGTYSQYAPAPQDPSMYYGGYPGYGNPNYQQPPQQQQQF